MTIERKNAKITRAHDATNTMRPLTTNLLSADGGFCYISTLRLTLPSTMRVQTVTRKANLHKNLSWRHSTRIAQPGQISLFEEDVPSIPAPLPYSGPHKSCTMCRQYKPIPDFYAHTNSRMGVNSVCKACELNQHKSYSKANTIRLRVTTQNHRARSLGIPGILTEQDLAALLEQSPLCAYCGLDYTALNLGWHIDHVRPLADFKKGDTLAVNEIQNIALCCACCNRAKKDMSLEDFKAWLRAVQGGKAIREARAPYAA